MCCLINCWPLLRISADLWVALIVACALTIQQGRGLQMRCVIQFGNNQPAAYRSAPIFCVSARGRFVASLQPVCGLSAMGLRFDDNPGCELPVTRLWLFCERSRINLEPGYRRCLPARQTGLRSRSDLLQITRGASVKADQAGAMRDFIEILFFFGPRPLARVNEIERTGEGGAARSGRV